MPHHERSGPHERRPPIVSLLATRSSAAVTWVCVDEDLDLATTDAAHAELRSIVDGSPPTGCVVVHLGVRRFVDLRAVRMLVRVAERVRGRGGALVVVAPSASLGLLVEHLGCHEELPVVPTTEIALEWVHRRSSRR